MAEDGPPDKCDGQPLLSISLAKFDMTLGAQIAATYPPEGPAPEATYAHVPDVCFPDGAHGFEAGCAFVTLRPKGEAQEQGVAPAFGLVAYAGKADKEQRRGFSVSAVLLVLARPLFASLQPLACLLVHKYVHGPARPWDSDLHFLQTVFTTLSAALASTETGRVDVERLAEAAEPDDFLQLTPALLAAGVPAAAGGADATDRLPVSPDEACSTASAPPDISGSIDDSVLDDSDSPSAGPREAEPPDALSAAPPATGGQLQPITVTHTRPFTLWGQQHSVLVPSTTLGQLGFGCALSLLLSHFGEELIAIWHALMCRRSVLFVGRSSALVGECVLAATHLVQPIELPAALLHPYITLKVSEDLKPEAFWIAGATNPWFDFRTSTKPFAHLVCCVGDGVMDAAAGPGPCVDDRRFMQYVLQHYPSNRGEAWLRKLFALHTRRALNDLHQQLPERHSEFPALVPLLPTLPSPRDIRRALQQGNKHENSVHLRYQQLAKSFATLFAACARILESLRSLVERSGEEEAQLYAASADLFRTLCATFGWASEGIAATVLQSMKSAVAATAKAAVEARAASQRATTTKPPPPTRKPFPPGDPLRPLEGQTEGTDLTVWAEPGSVVEYVELQYAHNRQCRLKVAARLRVCLDTLVGSLADGGNVARQHPLNRSFHDRFDVPPFNVYAITREVVIESFLCAFLASREKSEAKGKAAAVGWVPQQGRLFVTEHYLCLQASLLSRVAHVLSPAGDLVVPFQEVEQMAPFNALRVLPNALELVLQSGRKVYIGAAQHVSKFLPLLAFLHHRQRQVLNSAPPSAVRLSNTKGHTAPYGVYHQGNAVKREETWENQRLYPLLGWSSRLLPTDRHAWSDASGHHHRARDDIVLPDDRWEWVDDWHLEGTAPGADRWLYALDFAGTDWQPEPTPVHMVRRRRWCRTRELRPEVRARLPPAPPPRRLAGAAAIAGATPSPASSSSPGLAPASMPADPALSVDSVPQPAAPSPSGLQSSDTDGLPDTDNPDPGQP